MSFLFNKIKKESSPNSQENKPREKDLEEDGFVLVGQTEDEKNTLTPDKPEYNQDIPPSYQFSQRTESTSQQLQRNTKPPSYENFSWGSNQTFQQQQTQQNRATNESNTTSQSHHQNNNKTSVYDVPFQLANSVACAFNYGRLTVDIGDDFSTAWTSSEFEYDFSTERAVMQEMDAF